MRKRLLLVDAVSLVALLDAGDSLHERCKAALTTLRGLQLITTTPVLTEAMYFLGKRGGIIFQEQLCSMHGNGVLLVYSPTNDFTKRCCEIMRVYADLPCDFAYASLVAAAEALEVNTTFTCDGHFYVYRLANGQSLNVVPGPQHFQ